MMTGPLQTTRRAFLAGGLAALSAPLFGPVARAAASACDVAGRKLTPQPDRAVSLRRLMDALGSCRPGDRSCAELLRFSGMTRLEGYVADPENRDIILWGAIEPGAPPLRFEDFVVAMRSAAGRYTIERDGKRYIQAPAISIDPDPDVMRGLSRLDLTTPAGRRRHAEICRTPQTVRVEGMPRHSRVASVLVDADYRMKKVSQGTVTLPIRSPFPATTTASWEKTRADVAAGREPVMESVNTRFWFEPGQFTYRYDVDGGAETVFLDTAMVVLSDENQMVPTSGALRASGKVNPFSRAFACAWTDRMEDVYRAEPVWRDMHNIFRHFALARVIVERDALRSVNFASDSLLDRYAPPSVTVPDSLTGLGRVEEFTHRAKRGGRTMSQTLFSAVCGGVSVGFTSDNLIMRADDGTAGPAGRMVLASRAEPAAVAWAIVPGKTGPARPAVTAKPPPAAGGSISDILKRYSNP